MLIVVALPIFPACAAANVENALISVNRGSAMGGFSSPKILWASFTPEKLKSMTGLSDMRKPGNCLRLPFGSEPEPVPIFLAAARWEKGYGLAVALE